MEQATEPTEEKETAPIEQEITEEELVSAEPEVTEDGVLESEIPEETEKRPNVPYEIEMDRLAKVDISPEDERAIPASLKLLDTFYATAYYTTGTTATGTYTTEHRTLAVNPRIIPYGSHVWLYLDDGTLVGDYFAEDTGGNMMANPYVVDIYMGNNRAKCVEWGARHVSIYVADK